MTEMTDEELRQFLRENMARIKVLAQEGEAAAEDIADEFRSGASESADRLKEKLSEKKEKARGTIDEIYSAVMNPAAHRHFVRMGLEFFMGLSAIMDNMPMPDVVKKVREDVEETKAGVQSEFCRANDNCAAKKKASDSVERIEID